ncbi:MAG: hypothetical protein CMJ86_01100 [Planctomycetes bacterium]|nr:hypothetical protein [Planctomycetota bacterium]
MAGLGNNVGTSFFLRSLMGGTQQVAGQTIQPWFFTDSTMGLGYGFMGDRRIPSTHIEPIEGQLITLEFRNTSPMDHTIHLHGLDVDMANDGVPQTSQVVPPMQTQIYSFTAPHAGTYMYHCHVDTVLHFARGMVGTVIVRPPNGATNIAWDGGPSFDEEVLWHLATYDTTWKNLTASGPETTRMRPDAFMINGLETAAASADPYSRIELGAGQKGYLRLTNTAYQWARVSMDGVPFSIVASDGRPMATPKLARHIELGPGERYDILLENVPPGTYTARVDYLDDATGRVLGSASSVLVAN